MKIIEAIWFTEMGALRPIGIVIGEDEKTGQVKAYIGMGNGNDEEQDAEKIARTGAKFSPQIAKSISGKLNT